VAESDKVFAGSVPEIYDRLMVPLIFDPYAADIAARAGRLAPRDLLEVAAGTGAVTRALAAALGADARMTVTDLNPPMLAQARLRLPDPRITWQQADALALPFADASFDVVVCQFGAMFFPDKTQGYAQARRVLKAGGVYLFNVWDDIAANDFAAVAMQALAELFPHDPPRFMARTPHGYHDADRIRSELAAAGFAHIAIETVAHRSKAASANDVAIAYCHGTPWRGEIEARDPAGLATATTRVADAIARRFGTGAVDGKISALVIEARRRPQSSEDVYS